MRGPAPGSGTTPLLRGGGVCLRGLGSTFWPFACGARGSGLGLGARSVCVTATPSGLGASGYPRGYLA